MYDRLNLPIMEIKVLMKSFEKAIQTSNRLLQSLYPGSTRMECYQQSYPEAQTQHRLMGG